MVSCPLQKNDFTPGNSWRVALSCPAAWIIELSSLQQTSSMYECMHACMQKRLQLAAYEGSNLLVGYSRFSPGRP